MPRIDRESSGNDVFGPANGSTRDTGGTVTEERGLRSRRCLFWRSQKSPARVPCWLAPGWDRAQPDSSPARRSVRCCVVHRSPVTTSFASTMVASSAACFELAERRRARAMALRPGFLAQAADSQAGAPAGDNARDDVQDPAPPIGQPRRPELGAVTPPQAPRVHRPGRGGALRVVVRGRRASPFDDARV